MNVGEAQKINELATTLENVVTDQQKQIYDIMVLLKELNDLMVNAIKEARNDNS